MNFNAPQTTIFLVVLASVFVAECMSDNKTVTVDAKKGSRISCYKCNTYETDECHNPEKYPGKYEQVCAADEDMCRKIEQNINIDGKDETRVHRQCATKGSLGDCLERTGTYKFKTWYCQCKGDFCNSASLTSLSTSLSAIAVLVFMLRKMIL